MDNTVDRISSTLSVIAFVVLAVAVIAPAWAQSPDSILTDNVVPLREVDSPNGFVHPGISCNAETLSVMREKVIHGVSPWVDYFEGMRRTRFADLNRKPALVRQITNDGGISAFAHDAHLAWVHTILYVVTGNEAYRKTPVEIIRWYGSRTDESFFPKYFSDSHIKIGKYVYTLCSAVDILRATTPKDEKLAVTQEMVDALQKYCMDPIRKNCIQRNDYFMNQHSYAIMGYLASSILGDEVEDYKQVVEWTTVNATTSNWGRSGSIKHQIRMVTRNDKTGETVEPNLQVVEMGRDMPHAEGNLTNLLMMSKTIDFQKTKVDPVTGAVTGKSDGVSPVHFLDDRLPKGTALYAKYNLGYGLPWVPTYSETDPNHPDYLARYDQISYFGRGSMGAPGSFYYFKAIGLDMESGPYRYIKAAFDATVVGREFGVRSGTYLDQLHNYGFDFWIGLPAAASDAPADPEKAKRALATVLPKMEVTRDGAPVEGQQFEYQFADLSAHAQPGDIYPGSSADIPLKVMRDADGTGYVRMTIEKTPRTITLYSRFPQGTGLRVRSNSFVKLSFYRDEDFALRGCQQELYVPDTQGQWRDVITSFDGSGLTYIYATPLAGPATIDFDRLDTDKSAPRALSFDSAHDAVSIPSFVGAKISRVFTAAGGTEALAYNALSLPAGAEFDPATGALSWTPAVGQEGDHAFYVVARDGDTLRTLRVDVHVSRDLEAALKYVARPYDPAKQYTAASEKAFKTALESHQLAALQQAVDRLQLLNPRLPDGTLDYRVASCPPDRGLNKMADNDPLTWGGLWGFDKNVTLDFGRDFKVKTRAVAIQTRNGFPVRVTGAVVYASNNGFDWTLLTENAAKSLPDRQTLTLKKSLQETPYRFLRLFMPAKAYGIFEIGELRIDAERIEDYSPDYHKAYIKGFEDGTFRPDQPLTRAEAASSLANVIDDYTDRGAYACDYTDVDQKAWYYDDLAYMTKKGLIKPASDKAFMPDAPITRGELAGVLSRINKLTGRPDVALRDVTSTTPNAAEIRCVAAKGWLTADDTGEFHPNDSVTRAQFVVAVNKMLGRNEPGDQRKSAFKDVDRSCWAYAPIMEATQTHAVE